ncbi:MAG: hypothetical protein JWM19_6052 [Actinomycetia bacterium]|nr:hypothetical protein [Actinomycetes bacterium]
MLGLRRPPGVPGLGLPLGRNRINRNDYWAAWIYDGGRGVFEDNDLTANKRGAWNIVTEVDGQVTRARNRE